MHPMNLRDFQELSEALKPVIKEVLKEAVREEMEEFRTQLSLEVEGINKRIEGLTDAHNHLEMDVRTSKAKIAGIAAATGGAASVLAWVLNAYMTLKGK